MVFNVYFAHLVCLFICFALNRACYVRESSSRLSMALQPQFTRN